jgi:hypothetical protein
MGILPKLRVQLIAQKGQLGAGFGRISLLRRAGRDLREEAIKFLPKLRQEANATPIPAKPGHPPELP